MIEVRHGNLLTTDAEALVNTVNCVGVMGKGVALQFKQAYPENFRQYERACRDKKVRPGQMFIVPTGKDTNPKYIINFPTKRHWKGKSKLEDIRSGLEALVDDVQRLGIRSIALPPLGCGNGGLEWSDVEPLIEAAFAWMPEVQVIVFPPNGAPSPISMPVATSRPDLTRSKAILICLFDHYSGYGYCFSALEGQKLAYFLQEAGEPLRLRYVKHKYGPYAHNLNHVLQRLEGHFIRGYGDLSGGAEISLLPGAAQAAQDFLSETSDALTRIERVNRLIDGFETPSGMELLATVHWVAKDDLFAANDVSVAVSQVHAWSRHKQKRFSPIHIKKAWERLRDEGWLTSAEVSKVGE
jgi:O-acetyl-ADP-ribose deacetylase (regulator of RNase III)